MAEKNRRYMKKENRNEEITIASELGYSRKVIELLKSEPNPYARQRILHDARLGYYN